MSNLREEFEKSSNIKCFINIFEFDEVTNEYKYKNGKNIGDHTLGFVNGAWYAFQEQQKKIDEFASVIHEAYMSDGDSSMESVYDKIQELLK